jgi:hypothetical protein
VTERSLSRPRQWLPHLDYVLNPTLSTWAERFSSPLLRIISARPVSVNRFTRSFGDPEQGIIGVVAGGDDEKANRRLHNLSFVAR